MPAKNVNIKVPAAEYSRMVEVAKRELVPLTVLLRRCFAVCDRDGKFDHSSAVPSDKPHTQPQQPTPQKSAVEPPKPVKPTPETYNVDVSDLQDDIDALGTINFDED